MLQLGKIGKIQQTSDDLVNAIDKKYKEDFGKIEAEFKTMETYINTIEQNLNIKLEMLEKRVIELEKERKNNQGELQSGQLP